MTIPRRVRIGVQLTPQHAPYSQIRSTLADLEALGVDVVFNWDHFFPLSGDPNGTHFEAWTMLAAWAEATERIEFGPLVTCNSYRNPDLLADMARTVDHISARDGHGRLIFGIGSGWFERDYVEYGYEFGTAGQRLDALAAAMPRIERRWAALNPPPTRQLPVLIGGGGEKKTLRIVAEHADIWHTFVGADELAHKLDVLRAHCLSAGTDADAIEISAGVRLDEDGTFSAASIESRRSLGASLFTIGLDAGGDYGPVRELLAWRDSENARGDR